MSDTFGTTPDTFDLDAWIDQATRPRREVTIYRDWALLEEYDRLAAQLGDDREHDDETMGDEGPDAIREQMRDVLARMEASALTFTVQALTGAEQKELAEQAPTKAVVNALGEPVLDAQGNPREKVDEVALGDAMLAKAIISPTITVEQIQRMRINLGDGPVHPLYAAVAELRNVGEVLPEVPSSRER